jgi:flagellar motor switch protein FliG
MAEPAASKLDGVGRAAVLLLTLGEEDAAQVLKHMGPKEVQKLGNAMATIANISQAQVNGVLGDFLDAAGRHSSLGVDSAEFIRKVLVRALGEDKASSVVERILYGGSAQGLETLKWMEPRAVAAMVRNEHPQIIAIVLSYLDADQSAGVLAQLPERLRPDVLMRIATLDAVQPAALQRLNEVIEQQLSGSSVVQSASVGGVKTAAEILNFMDSGQEGEIMERLKETDEALGQKIQDLMFVFDNLMDADDAGLQHLLREVSSESLVLALKGTDETLREKFFRNMSQRAGEMLREDLEAKGPVRLSDVETAQKEILAIARRMSDEGRIVLGGKGGEQFV